MQLGISSFTFGWAVGVAGHPPPRPLDEHALIDYAQAHGTSRLQIGDNLPLHRHDAPALAAIAAHAVRAGITLEVGARGLTPEHLRTYRTIARRLDAPLLRFVVDTHSHRPNAATIMTTLRDTRADLGDLLIGIENHDRLPAQVLRSIIEQVGSPQVGICLDTANSLGAGEGLATVIEQLGPHTVNLHIKDFAIARVPHQMGFVVEGRPAGQGLLDIPALLAAIRNHSRCQSATLELWTPPEATLAATIAKEQRWAGESITYLRQTLRGCPHPPTPAPAGG